LVRDDEFLREALRGLRRNAAIIAFEDLDLAARDRVAVLFEKRRQRGIACLTGELEQSTRERRDPTHAQRRQIGCASNARHDRCRRKRTKHL
jgi:hypothetical protein